MLISKAGSFFGSVCLAELIYRFDFCIGCNTLGRHILKIGTSGNEQAALWVYKFLLPIT